MSFDSLGNVLSQTDPLVVTRYLFTGRELDGDLDLYYFRSRYYEASTGRFLSEDPLGYAGGQFNTSVYVSNSPLLYVDSNGTILVPIVAAGGIIGGVIGGIDSIVNGEGLGGIIKGTVSGAVSGAVGAGVGTFTRNGAIGGAIGGAAGGAVGDFLDQLFNKKLECFDIFQTGTKALEGAAIGAIAGGFAGKVFKPRPGTFSPNPFKPRPFSEIDPFGPINGSGSNSRKIIKSVIYGSTISETVDRN